MRKESGSEDDGGRRHHGGKWPRLAFASKVNGLSREKLSFCIRLCLVISLWEQEGSSRPLPVWERLVVVGGRSGCQRSAIACSPVCLLPSPAVSPSGNGAGLFSGPE
ncbi:hypothetical protein INR49_020697, partial [Caranx melampygus]